MACSFLAADNLQEKDALRLHFYLAFRELVCSIILHPTIMAASNHGSGLQLSNSLNTTINQQQEGQNAIESVGPGAANFVTEMSIIVIKNAPFNVEKWKNIPEDIFNKIVSKVLDAFDIDNTTHNIIENQYKTTAIALEHRPDDVGEDDWKFLVDFFQVLTIR
ncbi:hypothetical protein P8452_46817 [Trifolium repens]|nr:hypothetical protein P8452_46817 [Trifolium repens]